MMVYGYLALKQFPKHETHVMGAEIRRSMLTLQRLIITAFKRYHKKTTLTDMDIELTMLKRMIRTAKDMRYLEVRPSDTPNYIGNTNLAYKLIFFMYRNH